MKILDVINCLGALASKASDDHESFREMMDEFEMHQWQPKQGLSTGNLERWESLRVRGLSGTLTETEFDEFADLTLCDPNLPAHYFVAISNGLIDALATLIATG